MQEAHHSSNGGLQLLWHQQGDKLCTTSEVKQFLTKLSRQLCHPKGNGGNRGSATILINSDEIIQGVLDEGTLGQSDHVILVFNIMHTQIME